MLGAFDTKDKQSFLENNPLPQDRLSKLKDKAGIVLPELYQCARRGDIPGDLERIRELLTEAISKEASQHPVNRRCGRTGRNCLHEAATFGHKAIVDMLCTEFNADVQARTLMGNDTPLHYAASKGHRAVCFWLITVYGADPNATNKYNWTPLHYACQYSSMSVVKCICRYGGRTTHKTDDGDTPIMLAVRRGASETLIDYLAKVSQEQERDRFREDVEGRRREQMELAAIRDKEMSGTREELEKRFLAEQRAEYEKWRHGGDVDLGDEDVSQVTMETGEEGQGEMGEHDIMMHEKGRFGGLAAPRKLSDYTDHPDHPDNPDNAPDNDVALVIRPHAEEEEEDDTGLEDLTAAMEAAQAEKDERNRRARKKAIKAADGNEFAL